MADASAPLCCCAAARQQRQISNWDVASVTDMSSLFANQTTCNPPIGKWVTAEVIDTRSMFAGASAFNQAIGKWDTAKVTDMSYMFSYAASFNRKLCWKRTLATNMTDVLTHSGCPSKGLKTSCWGSGKWLAQGPSTCS